MEFHESWQPVLQGTLVSIRPLVEHDLEALYRVARDPAIWDQHPAKRYKREVFEPFFKDSIASKGAVAVLDPSTGQIIGSSRYQVPEGFHGTVEIGYTFLGRSYWGGPYNSELKKLMIDYAFKQVDTVFFYVDKNNFRSQKAVQKLGAILQPETKRKGLPRTKAENLIYALPRSKWK